MFVYRSNLFTTRLNTVTGKLLRIGEKYDFCGENFRRLLAFAVPKDATPPNFVEKTFANGHKTTKFTKVFSSKVSHYTVCVQLYSTYMCTRVLDKSFRKPNLHT